MTIEEINTKIVKLSDVAKEIGNEPKEITLPNGQTKMSLYWDAQSAQEAVKYTTSLASSNQKIVFDGPVPAWFAASLSHSVHPMPVGLNDPKIGVVDIPQAQKGEPDPDCGVEFVVTEGRNFVRIDWQLTDLVYDAANLNKIVLPEIPAGKEVILGGGPDMPKSGKGPNYIAVTIGEAYAHTNKSVSYYQPKSNGYVCGITHWPQRHIGDIIPMAEIEKDLTSGKDIGKDFFGGETPDFSNATPPKEGGDIRSSELAMSAKEKLSQDKDYKERLVDLDKQQVDHSI